MHLQLLILVGILATIVLGQSSTTQSGVPLSRSGYTYSAGFAASPVTVEMVIDLTCSATRDAWDVLSAVVHTYSDSVRFRIKILPLPYHQYSFLVSKAASTVFYYEGDGEAFKFMNEAILKQPDIYNSVTMDSSYNDIKEMVRGWATNSTSISSRNFDEGFDTSTDAGNKIEMFTRYEFKTAAIESQYGTPMFTINGLKMNGLVTFKEWEETLNPLTEKKQQLEADPSIIYL